MNLVGIPLKDSIWGMACGGIIASFPAYGPLAELPLAGCDLSRAETAGNACAMALGNGERCKPQRVLQEILQENGWFRRFLGPCPDFPVTQPFAKTGLGAQSLGFGLSVCCCLPLFTCPKGVHHVEKHALWAFWGGSGVPSLLGNKQELFPHVRAPL